jgi:hypothetical protein
MPKPKMGSNYACLSQVGRVFLVARQQGEDLKETGAAFIFYIHAACTFMPRHTALRYGKSSYNESDKNA